MNLGRYERILVLDAGIDPLRDEEILEFFDLAQVPVDVEALDLEHFQTVLKDLLD
jgi:hypothetical protein